MIAKIIFWLISNQRIRRVIYESLDYLFKRIKYRQDGLTEQEKKQLDKEKAEIVEALLRVIYKKKE